MLKKYFPAARRVGRVFAGCLIMAVAWNMIYDPSGMVTGGFSGLGIMIRYATMGLVPGGIPLWASTLLLNVPVYLIGWLTRGGRFIRDSLAGTLLLSLAFYLVPTVDLVKGDMLLATVFGGVLGGFGTALILAESCSTGGTDMLAMIIAKYYHGRNLSQIIGVIDGLIVLSGAFVFGVPKCLYAALSVFIYAKVSDSMLTGRNFAKMLFVISDKNEEISRDILRSVDRGVSRLEIRGMYTGTDRSMLICVVSKKQMVPVKKIVRDHDPRAFLVISNVCDVRGEGFAEAILDDET